MSSSWLARSRPFTLLVAFALVACGPAPQPIAPAGPDSPALREAALAAVLDASWMTEIARDPDGLAALLDGPGGAGWLSLYHGDLDAADRFFEAAPGPAARVGRARVALERALTLSAARRLAMQTSLQLARYRRDHRDRLRVGPLEPVLLALTLSSAGAPPEEIAAARQALEPAPSSPVAASLTALLAHRSEGSPPPPDLPEPFAARLLAASQIAGGSLAPIPGDPSAPDVTDDLGADADAGITFSAHYFDLEVGQARVRRELLLAVQLAAGLGPADEIVRSVAAALWGAPLPAVLRSSPPSAESTSTPPRWVVLFGLSAVDLPDLLAGLPGAPRGHDLLSRLDGEAPEARLRAGTDAAATDLLLRLDPLIEQLALSAMSAGSSPEGAALVRDLGLGRRVADRVLRLRMQELAADGASAQAQRLGQRSMDMTPGGAGGRADATFTRISARNPPEFLLAFAGCLAGGRLPGQARDYVHPLLDAVDGLAGAAYALGQLDAASSIGVAGKTSQQ